MRLPDEDLTAARHTVERLFGECILRLQLYELLLKAIVSGHQHSASVTDIKSVTAIKEAQASRAAKTERKTMGTLVGEMLESFLMPDRSEGMPEQEGDAPSFAFRFQITFSPDEFARIKAEQGQLVQMRNDLVHHFLERHVLSTADGCLAAQQTLTDALDRIARACKVLRSWVSDMEYSHKVIAEHLASPDIRDFIVHRRMPWHILAVTRALHEAAKELAEGDWASVDAAACWIKRRYPEEQPKHYDCRSWQQVIRKSGQFDIQVRKVDGRPQRWYRPRVRESAQL